MLDWSILPSSRHYAGLSLRPYDLLCAFLAPWFAFALRDYNVLVYGSLTDYGIYAGVSFAVTAGVFLALRVGRDLPLYFSSAEGWIIIKASIIAVAISAFILFSTTRMDMAPRSVLLLHAAILAALLIGGRALSRRAARDRTLRQAHETEENILVIGVNALTAPFIRLAEGSPTARIRVLAILDENPRYRGRAVGGKLVIGAAGELEDILDEYEVHGKHVDRVIVVASSSELPRTAYETLAAALLRRSVRLDRLTNVLGFETARPLAAVAPVRSQPVIDLTGRRRYLTLKRAFDLALALAIAFTTFPAACLVALLVAIDVGFPVFFWQERLGRAGKPIHVYKFRTMRAPYDRHGKAVPPERRLSRIGAFLRATRLDEWPQLYNVLVGDMSFVGPRPLLPIDQPADASQRLAIAPGLTGWAQIHGGKLITPDEKNALDVWYVRNACFTLDMKIMARTAMSMILGDVRNEAVLEAALQAQEAPVKPPLQMQAQDDALALPLQARSSRA